MTAITNDLNDSLADLIGNAGTEVRTSTIVIPDRMSNATHQRFEETCEKCRGTGKFIGWSGRIFGDCFACKGKGKQVFKSSKEQRARATELRVERKAKREAEGLTAFAAAHPEVWAWIESAAPTFPFAQAMKEAIIRFGDLTERQLAACEKATATRAARKAEAEARKANAPEIAIDRIEQAFNAARASGLKYLKLNLDSFEFKPAGANSKNPGAIYVTEAGQYLGKVQEGKFFCSREATPDQQTRIVAVAADPEAAAVAFGKRTGVCSCCARELTNPESIERGIGPVCAERWGW
jgi:hypothetical protein